MKIVQQKRNSGKTTELIKLSSETWHYIACHSREECHRIDGMAQTLGIKIPFPITYQDIAHLRGSRMKGILIDNVELFLQSISPSIPITGFTMTLPE